MNETSLNQLAEHLSDKQIRRLDEATNRKVRRFMRLSDEATHSGRKQRYFERAAEAAAMSAELTRRLKDCRAQAGNG